MTASATIDKEKFFTLDKYPGPVAVPVEVRDPTGEVACNAKVKSLKYGSFEVVDRFL